MPSYDQSGVVHPNLQIKKVSWLELFFDIFFALALVLCAKPLEQVNGFSTESLWAVGKFMISFTFLIIFWYKHMVLLNRFDHNNFLISLVTLWIGLLVVAFTQFLFIWTVEPTLGSRLATITMSLIVASIALLYFLSSMRIVEGQSNEKIWARAVAKRTALEAVGYLTALLVTPGIRPIWYIVVFLYFNRYPFMNWVNPKAHNSMPAILQNIPSERTTHKTERIGLFSIMVYGLAVALASLPLFELSYDSSLGEVLASIFTFGKIFFFISIIWYVYYRVFDMVGPKGHQFTALNFISLALLIANTHFLRILLEHPSDFISIIFAVSLGLLFTIIAIVYWNAKAMAGFSLTETAIGAFKQWSYLLYASSAALFASVLFPSPLRETIWDIVLMVVFIGLVIEPRLNVKYYMGTRKSVVVKYFDNQTVSGLTFMAVGGIAFFVINILLGKPAASLWIFIWGSPLIIGVFIIMNHWLHNRIKPN